MTSLTIRCHPVVPVPIAELEEWLERELVDLRDDLPDLHIRLLRLSQPLVGDELPVGWLLECRLEAELATAVEERLLATLGDMRLLGMQPTLLRRQDAADGTLEVPS